MYQYSPVLPNDIDLSLSLPDCGHHCVQSQVKFIYIAHATGVDSMCFKIKSKKHRQMQSYMEKNISDKNIGGIRM